MCCVCSAQGYLPDGCVLSLARRVGGGVVGIVEGLLVRVHGDLVLPIEAMVTQLRHPFIKQLLRFNLQSTHHNQNHSQGESRNKGVKVK